MGEKVSHRFIKVEYSQLRAPEIAKKLAEFG